jgi:hypothetical protein
MPQNRGAFRRATRWKKINKSKSPIVIRIKIKFYLGESAFLPKAAAHIQSVTFERARYTHTHIQRQEQKKNRSLSVAFDDESLRLDVSAVGEATETRGRR